MITCAPKTTCNSQGGYVNCSHTGQRSVRSYRFNMSRTIKHPIQPVIDDGFGVHRFKQNAIVRWMLDKATDAHLFDLNEIARLSFSDEDREQLAQLIGYSVSGACDLSYVSNRVAKAGSRASKKLRKKVKRARRTTTGSMKVAHRRCARSSVRRRGVSPVALRPPARS